MKVLGRNSRPPIAPVLQASRLQGQLDALIRLMDRRVYTDAEQMELQSQLAGVGVEIGHLVVDAERMGVAR